LHAAAATVAGRPYEEIAEAIGFKLNPSTGTPTHTPWPATDDCVATGKLLCERLAQYGFHPAEGLLMAGMLLGIPNVDAVFLVESSHPADQDKAHALARVDGQIIDPRQPDEPVSLEDVGGGLLCDGRAA
jgi:hypothetical protein